LRKEPGRRTFDLVAADWLNGIGLTLNMLGVVMIFVFGVPAYRPIADAGKSFLLLTQHDPEGERRTKRAKWLSMVGLGLLGAGFAVQFAALFAG
jgi:hypothetical protein